MVPGLNAGDKTPMTEMPMSFVFGVDAIAFLCWGCGRSALCAVVGKTNLLELSITKQQK